MIDSDEGDLAWVDDPELLTLELWEGDRLLMPWPGQDRFFSGKFVYGGWELKGVHTLISAVKFTNQECFKSFIISGEYLEFLCFIIESFHGSRKFRLETQSVCYLFRELGRMCGL